MWKPVSIAMFTHFEGKLLFSLGKNVLAKYFRFPLFIDGGSIHGMSIIHENNIGPSHPGSRINQVYPCRASVECSSDLIGYHK